MGKKNDRTFFQGRINRAPVTLKLSGYCATKRVLLQVSTLLFVQVHKICDTNASFLDPALEFNTCATKPKTVSRKLAQALYVTREDSNATVSGTMNYYKYLFKRTNHAPSTTNVPSGNNVVMSESETEISGSTLKLFDNAIDPHYKKTNGTQGLQLFRGKIQYFTQFASLLPDDCLYCVS